MSTVATVVLDDVDVTAFCVEGSVTHRLNRIGTASVKINMAEFETLFGSLLIPGPGSYLKIYLTNTVIGTTPRLWHHGRVLNCETTADVDTGYTVFNSSDPLEMWAHRPVRDPPQSTTPGNFSNPSIIQEFGDPSVSAGNGAPKIVQMMMSGSEDNTIPADSEGPLRLAQGGFASGEVTVEGVPTDWPMTMAQLTSLLVSTGVLDIVITPIEFDASNNYGQIDCYNGDYGTDLTGSVAFQYGMGAYNIQSLRWNEDMSNLCNKIWYYLGPKYDEQHWRANVQGDDPSFNSDGNLTGAWTSGNTYFLGNVVSQVLAGQTFYYIAKDTNTASAANEPGVADRWWDFWDTWMVPPGGRLSPSASATDNQLGVKIASSRVAYDVRMDVQIFDANTEALDARDMFRRLWQMESWLRSEPRSLVHITPTRDTAIGEFDIGDLVLVEAVSSVKGGFSGAQRIYEYTISWDAAESVCWIGELQVSSDNEGFG